MAFWPPIGPFPNVVSLPESRALSGFIYYKTTPGVVFQHILDWPTYGKKDSLEIALIATNRYSRIEQKVMVNDSTFNYVWDLNRINDSLTKVTARIRDLNHPWAQKIQTPFIQNNFVKGSIRNVENVGKQLLKKSENFKVDSFSDTLFQSKFCTYISIKSTVKTKAQTMLRDISLVMGYIKDHEIPLDGDPFLEVTEWNQENDSIRFNFCFPIQKRDSLPPNANLLFKETKPIKALKATFHGNYRISDQAWYYLLDEAFRKNRTVIPLPIELYLNDPHVGGNSLDWKAHILLPLGEKTE